MKLHFMVRKTREALKTIPPLHPDVTGGGGARVFFIASPSLLEHPRHVLTPLFHPLCVSSSAELLEVHTFSHLFGTFITLRGWEAITSVRRTSCVIFMSICLCEEMHLLLVMYVWNSSKGAVHFCFDRSEPVDTSVYWSECMC